MLPARDAPLGPGRALRFERALGTCGGPIAPQDLASLFVGIAIGQPLAGWTAIDVILGEVDEVLSAKAAICLPVEPIVPLGATFQNSPSRVIQLSRMDWPRVLPVKRTCRVIKCLSRATSCWLVIRTICTISGLMRWGR